MADKALDHDRAAVCRGVAAVLSAIDEIGQSDDGDRELAKHIVTSEMDVRALVKFALVALADDESARTGRQ